MANNKQQLKVGPIGHSLTQKVARVFMDVWEKKFIDLAIRNDMKMFMWGKVRAVWAIIWKSYWVRSKSLKSRCLPPREVEKNYHI